MCLRRSRTDYCCHYSCSWLGPWQTFRQHPAPSANKIPTLIGYLQKNPQHSNDSFFFKFLMLFLLVIHPRLDLVNMIVRPFLFNKLSLFTKSSHDKEKIWYEKVSCSLFINSSISLYFINRVSGVFTFIHISFHFLMTVSV